MNPTRPPVRLDEVMERLDRDLGALFGPGGFERWSEGAFVRVQGDVVVFVVASALDDDAVVNVRTYLARRPALVDGSLGLHLARLNAESLFGAYSIDDDGDVCFDYSLLASAATREALRVAVRSVVDAADRHGAELRARWGGSSSLEMLRQRIEGGGTDPDDEGGLSGPAGPN